MSKRGIDIAIIGGVLSPCKSINLTQRQVPITGRLLNNIIDSDDDGLAKRKTKRHGNRSKDLDLAERYAR